MSRDTRTEGSPADVEGSTDPPRPTLEATYHLERVIASGGMGVVLAAKHKHLGTRVAIKLLHDTHAPLRQRFLREAQLAAGLDSPFIVRVRDYGFADDGQPFLVMDLLEGCTLKARIRDRPLCVEEATRIATEIVRALIVVHDLHIVHRDIKPSNILLCRGDDGLDHVKLLDFGIAKRVVGEQAAEGDDLTGTNEILGTAAYMAPEQMIVSKIVDERADVFSVGAVLYEMLTGKPALRQDTRAYQLAMSQEAAHETITSMGELVHGVPAELEEVVMRCLSITPEHRFDSSRALLAALVVEPGPTSAPPQFASPVVHGVTTVESTANRGSPRRTGVWIAAIAILAGIAGIALMTMRAEPSSAAVWPPDEPTEATRSIPSSTVSSAAPLVVAPVTSPLPPQPSATASASALASALTSTAAPTVVRRPRATGRGKPPMKDPRFGERH